MPGVRDCATGQSTLRRLTRHVRGPITRRSQNLLPTPVRCGEEIGSITRAVSTIGRSATGQNALLGRGELFIYRMPDWWSSASFCSCCTIGESTAAWLVPAIVSLARSTAAEGGHMLGGGHPAVEEGHTAVEEGHTAAGLVAGPRAFCCAWRSAICCCWSTAACCCASLLPTSAPADDARHPRYGCRRPAMTAVLATPRTTPPRPARLMISLKPVVRS